MRAPVSPRVSDYRLHLVVRTIPLTLKLLEFLRCDAPVSSTLTQSLSVQRDRPDTKATHKNEFQMTVFL